MNTRVRTLFALSLGLGFAFAGCAGESAPPSFPTFPIEGGESDEPDGGSEEGGDQTDAIDPEDDIIDDKDIGGSKDGDQHDTSDGDNPDSGEEGGESDTDASGEGGETPDATETNCLEQEDPDGYCMAEMSPTGCELASCGTEGECVVETVPAPGCCIVDADCDDGNAITFDLCPGEGMACTNQVDPTQCEDNVLFLNSNFDDGTAQGWTVNALDSDDTVGWQLDTSRSDQGAFSFYFGSRNCPTYYAGLLGPDCSIPGGVEGAGLAQKGQLISPEFDIPSDSAVMLSFSVFADFELLLDPSQPACAEGTSPFSDPSSPCWSPEVEAEEGDNLTVWLSYYDEIAQENVLVELWNVVDQVAPFPAPSKGTGGQYLQVGADLSSYAGKAVRLVFEAHTDEFFSYGFEGAYVDTVLVRTGCGAALCDNDSDCQGPNTCKSFECTSLVNSDGGFCFGLEKKDNCVPCPGGTHPECNDGNECTTELCGTDNTCNYSAAEAAECCEGGNTNGPYDFEGGGLPAGWTVSGGSGNVTWGVTEADEGYDLYFGDPGSGTYDGVGHVFGSVTTGFFNLPLAPYALLATMELDLATEYEMGEYSAGDPQFDILTIHVLSNVGGQEVDTVIFDSLTDIGGATGYQQGKGTSLYENVGFDLSAWQGQSIRLRFSFDSVDGNNNDFAGVHIDNLTVLEVCEEPSCTLDDQCDDGLACSTDTCVSGFCANVNLDPTCCESDSECNDGNPCTNDNCVDNIGCVNEPVEDPNCCFEATDDVDDFETSDFGWTFDSISENVFWSFQNSPENGGFLYFGDPDTGTYETFEGTIAYGTAISPPFKVQPNGVSALSFDLFMETEWDNFPVPCDADCLALSEVNDVLRISVRDQFFVDEQVWTSPSIQNSTQGLDIPVELNLAAWAGQEIQVVFEFATADPIFNDYAGVRIDNLSTFVLCGDNIECFSDLDCEDTDEDTCTVPTCSANTCTEEPVLKLPECCFEVPVLNTNFDSGTLEGFEVVGLTCGQDTFQTECLQNDNASVKWHVSDYKANSPTHSLWFGNPSSETYDDPGLAVSGWATSKEVSLFPGLSAQLDMWVYLDVETYDPDFPDADKFEVSIVPESGAATIIWDKSQLPPGDTATWVNITYDLSGFAGETIQIEVLFDSFDFKANNVGAGIFTDDIQVIQGCSAL